MKIGATNIQENHAHILTLGQMRWRTPPAEQKAKNYNEEGDGVMNKNSLYQSMVLIKGEEETYK